MNSSDLVVRIKVDHYLVVGMVHSSAGLNFQFGMFVIYPGIVNKPITKSLLVIPGLSLKTNDFNEKSLNYNRNSIICYICIYIYIYIYIMYMWQMSSVFSHESAQRNDAGHLIDKNVFKTTRSFCYQWFHVSTLQANANRPFILSSMKRTTGGGHLENAFSRWPPPVVRFMLDNMNGLLAFAWRVETWNHW